MYDLIIIEKLLEYKIINLSIPAYSKSYLLVNIAEDSIFNDIIRLIIPLSIMSLLFIIAVILILLFKIRRSNNELRKENRLRKEKEAELLVAKEHAEESDLLKSAFLANMSHEIRTPLNAIVGFSEIMSELVSEENKKDAKQFREIIKSNNELLLQLINDILDISKIETGKIDFVFSSVNLSTWINEILQNARMKLLNPGVKVYISEQTDDIHLYTDKNRLTQVMMNLINNAAKYTHSGSISIGFRISRESNESIFFYCKDTGPGIPEEKSRAIFDRFVKLDTFKQGTGLGLSISKTIIERFGGQIGVKSSVGIGSEFWFVIPIKTTQLHNIKGLESVTVSTYKD